MHTEKVFSLSGEDVHFGRRKCSTLPVSVSRKNGIFNYMGDHMILYGRGLFFVLFIAICKRKKAKLIWEDNSSCVCSARRKTVGSLHQLYDHRIGVYFFKLPCNKYRYLLDRNDLVSFTAFPIICLDADLKFGTFTAWNFSYKDNYMEYLKRYQDVIQHTEESI